jgi:hypothetical protein
VKKTISLQHKFVQFLPDKLAERTVYVSMEYATVAHRCLCGCGVEIQTPLSPTDWQVSFDGETISLYPSIGNWGLPCRSHYWIDQSEGRWAGNWSKKEIAAGRERTLKERRELQNRKPSDPTRSTQKNVERSPSKPSPTRSLIERAIKRILQPTDF